MKTKNNKVKRNKKKRKNSCKKTNLPNFARNLRTKVSKMPEKTMIKLEPYALMFAKEYESLMSSYKAGIDARRAFYQAVKSFKSEIEEYKSSAKKENLKSEEMIGATFDARSRVKSRIGVIKETTIDTAKRFLYKRVISLERCRAYY